MSPAPRARSLAAACLVTGLSLAKGAGAAGEASTVIVLSPPGSDDVAQEATIRVEGELQAAGFHVAVLRAGNDAASEVETAGSELHPIAAFAIQVRREEHGTFAEIHVCDRLRQKTILERARLPSAEHPRESAVLAVRAVELLRASVAELGLRAAVVPEPEPVPSAAPAPPSSDRGPPPAVERRAARKPFGPDVGLGVGFGLVAAPRGVGPFWLPRLLASLGTGGAWAVRLEFEGLGPTAQVNARLGSAAVDLRMGTLGVARAWWPDARVVPFLSAAAGIQQVHVAGSAEVPYRGLTSDSWSLLTDAGIGVAVPFVPGLSFMVESRAALAWPPATIAIAGTDEGHVGGPSWLGDASFSGTFP